MAIWNIARRSYGRRTLEIRIGRKTRRHHDADARLRRRASGGLSRVRGNYSNTRADRQLCASRCRAKSGQHHNHYANRGTQVKSSTLRNADCHISSSCGICGKESIGAIRQNFPVIESAKTLASMLKHCFYCRRLYARDKATSPGLEAFTAAGVFGLDGTSRFVREDIGRHVPSIR